jgi:hypothetical protein
MTECLPPGPVPEPGYPHQAPDSRDLRPEMISAPATHPVSGFPLSGVASFRHLPPGAATRHPRTDNSRTARGAVPTRPPNGGHAPTWRSPCGERGDTTRAAGGAAPTSAAEPRGGAWARGHGGTGRWWLKRASISYVVTRSRPYHDTTRTARGAVPTSAAEPRGGMLAW